MWGEGGGAVGGGAVGYSETEKSSSAKICLNFNFRGGRGVFYRIGVNCRIWTKISTTPAGSCITDSLSHTTYVETNELRSHTFVRCQGTLRFMQNFSFSFSKEQQKYFQINEYLI